MRNQFTFYKSFDDVIEDMDNKQIALYIKTMLDVQFLRVKIEDVKFEDKMLSIVWKSQKHSIQTSIKGYIDSQKRDSVKNPYLGIYDPSCNPYEGVTQQGKEQVQDKEEGKGEEEEHIALENLKQEFDSIWKDYTLTFLKAQGRAGGTKKKALDNFIKLRKKHDLSQILNLVASEKKLKIGHKDLERVLREDCLKQFIEDDVSFSSVGLVPANLVGKDFKIDDNSYRFTKSGYFNYTKDFEITNRQNVIDMVETIKGHLDAR